MKDKRLSRQCRYNGCHKGSCTSKLANTWTNEKSETNKFIREDKSLSSPFLQIKNDEDI